TASSPTSPTRAETNTDEAPRGGLTTRQLLPLWIGLCLAAAFAWVLTIGLAGDMGAGYGTMGLSLVGFLVVWVVMMAAMMFPSVAPIAAAWIRTVAARPSGAARVGGVVEFLGGYLIAW